MPCRDHLPSNRMVGRTDVKSYLEAASRQPTNAPATPTNALVIIPRVDPENWRASHDGPASRSNKKPAMTPIARTRRNVTPGSVACMGQAALNDLDLKVACVIVVAVPWRRDNSANAI